ncbi:MAG: HAD family hydrolase [Halobacteriales archaeon]|nr:HAD family hydrolase [Halobacteriales archaeon]
MQPVRANGFRFLLFDLDGTLIKPGTDFAAMREEVRILFLAAGVPRDFPFRHILGGIDDAVDWLGAHGRAEEGRELRGKAYSFIEQREREGLARAVDIPGVVEALERWRSAGYQLGIYTRTHPDVLRDSVAKFRLGRFEVLLSRADCAPKPDPAQVHLALQRAGVAAEQALAIGDHVFDIQSARAARVRAVGVLTGSGTRDALLAAGAMHVVPAVPDVDGLLAKPF